METYSAAALFLDYLREQVGEDPPAPSAAIEADLLEIAGAVSDADRLGAAIRGLFLRLEAQHRPAAARSLERLLHTALGPQWTPSVADRVRRAADWAMRDDAAAPPRSRSRSSRSGRPPRPRPTGPTSRPRRKSGPIRPARTKNVSSTNTPAKASIARKSAAPATPSADAPRRLRSPAKKSDDAVTIEVAVDRSAQGAFEHMPMEEVVVALWRSYWTGTVYFAQDDAALRGGGDFAVAFRDGVPVAIGANIEATAKGLIRAFGWREGSFRRDPECLPPAGATEVMSPMALLIAGVVRGVPLGEVAQAMADSGCRYVVATNLAKDAPGCASLSAKCNGTTTMREFVAGSPDSAKALYGMYCAAVAHVVAFRDEVTTGPVVVDYANVRAPGENEGPAPGMDRRKAHTTVLALEKAYSLLGLKTGCGPARVSSAFVSAVGRGISAEERAELAAALDTVMTAEKAAQDAAAQVETAREACAPPPPNTGALATSAIAKSSYTRGMAAMQHGEHQRAIQYFEQAVEFEPERTEYRIGFYLATARAELRRVPSITRQIEQWLDRLYQEGPSRQKERSQVHLLAGRLYQLAANHEEAEDQFLRAVTADRKNSEAAAELRRSKMLHKPSAKVKRVLNKRLF